MGGRSGGCTGGGRAAGRPCRWWSCWVVGLLVAGLLVEQEVVCWRWSLVVVPVAGLLVVLEVVLVRLVVVMLVVMVSG